MTDRHAAYIVILSGDIREDDTEHTINALRMVKGVASVEPVLASYDQQIARTRADTEWVNRISEMVRRAREEGR